MRRRLKIGLLLTVILVTILSSGLWALPRLAKVIPSRIKPYLPQELLALVQTPLPTALPAPDVTAVPPRITIPLLPTLLPTATAVPPTNQQTNKPANQPTNPPSDPPTLTPTPFPTPLPASAQIARMIIKPQKFNNCGPTNLSLVLHYYGHEVDQLDIAAVLKPNEEDRNVSPEELAAYVNEQTSLRAGVYSGGDLTLLKRSIAAGYPVIVEKGLLPSEWEGWMGHYLTIYGYDDAAREFRSMDTFLGPWDGSGRTDSYETITEFWSQFNYTFVLVYPPNRETAVLRLLGQNLIDPLAMWQHAARLAQAEIDAKPENANAWFNLGTSLSRLGELTEEQEYFNNAAAAFDQARTLGLPWRMLWYQFQPYVAYLATGRYDDVLTLADTTRAVEESFLYKGHALLARGDESGAAAVYKYALELNPNFTPAQQALDLMRGNG